MDGSPFLTSAGGGKGGITAGELIFYGAAPFDSAACIFCTADPGSVYPFHRVI